MNNFPALSIALPPLSNFRPLLFPIGFFAAVLVYQFLQDRWRKHREAIAMTWPLAQATIERAFIEKSSGRKATTYKVSLGYSFKIEGQFHSGRIHRSFYDEDEAHRFADTMRGRPIAVHYRPDAPQNSLITSRELDAVMALVPAATAVPEPESAVPSIAPRYRPLLLPLFLFAFSGFIVSVWVHLAAIAGRSVLPGYFFGLLHAGIFVVWLPAVLILGTGRRKGRMFSWEESFPGCPAWVSPALQGLLYYALANFAYFMYLTMGYPRGRGIGLEPIDWRGFSGHWMVFYATAAAALYSGLQSTKQSDLPSS